MIMDLTPIPKRSTPPEGFGGRTRGDATDAGFLSEFDDMYDSSDLKNLDGLDLVRGQEENWADGNPGQIEGAQSEYSSARAQAQAQERRGSIHSSEILKERRGSALTAESRSSGGLSVCLGDDIDLVLGDRSRQGSQSLADDLATNCASGRDDDLLDGDDADHESLADDDAATSAVAATETAGPARTPDTAVFQNGYAHGHGQISQGQRMRMTRRNSAGTKRAYDPEEVGEGHHPEPAPAAYSPGMNPLALPVDWPPRFPSAFRRHSICGSSKIASTSVTYAPSPSPLPPLALPETTPPAVFVPPDAAPLPDPVGFSADFSELEHVHIPPFSSGVAPLGSPSPSRSRRPVARSSSMPMASDYFLAQQQTQAQAQARAQQEAQALMQVDTQSQHKMQALPAKTPPPGPQRINFGAAVVAPLPSYHSPKPGLLHMAQRPAASPMTVSTANSSGPLEDGATVMMAQMPQCAYAWKAPSPMASMGSSPGLLLGTTAALAQPPSPAEISPDAVAEPERQRFSPGIAPPPIAGTGVSGAPAPVGAGLSHPVPTPGYFFYPSGGGVPVPTPPSNLPQQNSMSSVQGQQLSEPARSRTAKRRVVSMPMVSDCVLNSGLVPPLPSQPAGAGNPGGLAPPQIVEDQNQLLVQQRLHQQQQQMLSELAMGALQQQQQQQHSATQQPLALPLQQLQELSFQPDPRPQQALLLPSQAPLLSVPPPLAQVGGGTPPLPPAPYGTFGGAQADVAAPPTVAAVAPVGNDVATSQSHVSNPSQLNLLEPDVFMGKLKQIMSKSQETMLRLQEYDKANGLPKSHSSTMVKSNRSRRQLQEGVILKKWDGSPLIHFEKTEDGRVVAKSGPKERRNSNAASGKKAPTQGQAAGGARGEEKSRKRKVQRRASC